MSTAKSVIYCSKLESKFNFTTFFEIHTDILSGVPGIITGFLNAERIRKSLGLGDFGIKSELLYYPMAY